MTTRLRVYARWAGNEKGTQEDVTRCIESVHGGAHRIVGYQCSKKRGYGPDGLYCKQHDPAAQQARDSAMARKWELERARSEVKWSAESFACAMYDDVGNKSVLVGSSDSALRKAYEKYVQARKKVDRLASEGKP